MTEPDQTAPDDAADTPFVPRLREMGVETWLTAIGCKHPAEVSGADEEYRAVREACGVMDFSFILKHDVEGPGALDVADSVVTRDLHRLEPGHVSYAAIVGGDGKMLDDVTVYVYSPEHVRVAGGTTIAGDLLAERGQAAGVTVTARRDEIAQLCLQGPLSREILAELTPVDVSNEGFPYYTYLTGVEVAGMPAQINRIGFTAELGFEVWVAPEDALTLWDAVFAAGEARGIRAIGGTAIMRLRTEAGMIMGDGFDHDPSVTPWECRMGWAVDLDKQVDFLGREALEAARASAPKRLATVEVETKNDDLFFTPLQSEDGREVGRLNMTVFSPLRDKTIALARIDKDSAKPGTRLVAATASGELIDAQVVATPIYDPQRTRVRA